MRERVLCQATLEYELLAKQPPTEIQSLIQVPCLMILNKGKSVEKAESFDKQRAGTMNKCVLALCNQIKRLSPQGLHRA